MTKAAMEPNSEIDSEHVFDVADESLDFTKEFHQFYGVYKSLIDLLHFIVINAANIDENQDSDGSSLARRRARRKGTDGS